MLKLNLLVCLLLGASTTLFSQQIERGYRTQSGQETTAHSIVLKSDKRVKGFRPTNLLTTQLPRPVAKTVNAVKADALTAPRKSTLKANQKASLQGFLGYYSGAQYYVTRGWFDINTPNINQLWSNESYVPTCGFVREGELHTWNHYSTNGSGLERIGMRSYNLETGEVTHDETFSVFDQLDHLVYSCAYDQDNDLVYLVTSRADDANLYQTMTYNPVNKTYTRIGNINDSDWPLAMAWSPTDGNIYSFYSDGTLKTLDKQTGSFKTAISTSHSVSDYTGSMVYSPKDGGLLYMMSSYDDDSITEVGVINLTTGEVSTLGEMAFEQQWNVLYCPDPYAAADAPQAATLESWDFTGNAKSGNLVIKMPSVDNNGNALTQTLFVEVNVDNETTPRYDNSATAGQSVSIPLTLTEGLHNIIVRPYIYKGIDKVFASKLKLTKYVGNDTPSAPTGVTLSKTQVSWDAVTTGVNGGYVNSSIVRYHVYINGEKMNSSPINGTSFDIKLPGGATLYTAEVEATAAGKTSQRGVSAPLAADGPISLPFYLGPNDGETDMPSDLVNLFTIVNKDNDEFREWRYDDQAYNSSVSSNSSGGFYHLARKNEEKADAWLFLPAAMFDDASAIYNFSFEASATGHPFATTERFEIGISSDTNPNNVTIIKEATEVTKTYDFTPIEVLFKVPESGAKYIGIHCISDPDTYRLYVRNFRCSKTQSTNAAPGAVNNILVTANAEGKLNAQVEFDMPTIDLAGNALDANTEITATVSTDVATQSVTAKKGEHASVNIECQQGSNTFKITTACGNNTGATSSTIAFVGVDVPRTPLIEQLTSADNMSLTLNWRVEKVGENGGAVIPEDCEYEIYRNNGGSWIQYANVGKATTYTYTHKGSKQEIIQLAVLAKNDAGESSSMSTAIEILGTPYTIPMSETFEFAGENVNLKYEPYMIQNISELAPSWGFVDPASYESYGAVGNDSGIALSSYYAGTGQITFPKFSTKGFNNVKLDLSMLFGSIMPTNVYILASTDNDKNHLVAEFTPSDGNGWENRTISLPQSMQNKDWVAFTIRITATNYSQFFMLDKFAISNYPDNDLALTSLNGDLYGNVGDELSINTTIQNLGAQSIAAPSAKYEVLKGKDVIASENISINENINATSDASYSFKLTPQAEWLGNCKLRVSIDHNDAVASNNVIETDMKIFANNIPVPQNLTGQCNETTQKVDLQWDEPMTIFGAEELMPYALSEKLGDFANMDNDQMTPYALNGIVYPHKYDARAFMVIPVSIISQLQPLVADAGQNVFFVAASNEGEVDDWLISPEVKGGSMVKFRMACASQTDNEEYLDEKIEVWYSKTDDKQYSFIKLDEFTQTEVAWKDVELTLPEDAKYFALRYAMPEKGFCLFIDNITYSPLSYPGTLLGYNVYRSGAASPYAVVSSPWTDEDYDAQRPAAYQVRTRMNLGGGELESAPSNSVVINPASIISLSRESISVTSGRGYLQLNGMEGSQARISTIDGKNIDIRNVTQSEERVSLMPGVYMVTNGNRTFKVMVK